MAQAAVFKTNELLGVERPVVQTILALTTTVCKPYDGPGVWIPSSMSAMSNVDRAR